MKSDTQSIRLARLQLEALRTAENLMSGGTLDKLTGMSSRNWDEGFEHQRNTNPTQSC